MCKASPQEPSAGFCLQSPRRKAIINIAGTVLFLLPLSILIVEGSVWYVPGLADARDRRSLRSMNRHAAKRFGRATQENVGLPFAIVLDNKVLSAVTRRDPTIVPRVWPVAEALMAIILLDNYMQHVAYQSFFKK